jgi:2-dehydropantoate 2-reductase
LVLLSCKAYDLDDAIGSIAPAIGGQTALLPLLNGVVHIPRLKERFGSSRVLGGVAHLAVVLRSDGIIHHLSSQCAIRFGPLRTGPDPWTPILLDLLKRARVDAVRSLTIEQDLWDKFVFLATLAGMTCLMRSNVGTILDTSDGKHLIQQLLSECSEIAAAEGFPPNEAALAEYRALLTQRGSSLTASMFRDIEHGGPTEGDHLLGDLAQRATANRIAAPLLRVAYTHLQAYERQRKV